MAHLIHMNLSDFVIVSGLVKFKPPNLMGWFTRFLDISILIVVPSLLVFVQIMFLVVSQRVLSQLAEGAVL